MNKKQVENLKKEVFAWRFIIVVWAISGWVLYFYFRGL